MLFCAHDRPCVNVTECLCLVELCKTHWYYYYYYFSWQVLILLYLSQTSYSWAIVVLTRLYRNQIRIYLHYKLLDNEIFAASKPMMERQLQMFTIFTVKPLRTKLLFNYLLDLIMLFSSFPFLAYYKHTRTRAYIFPTQWMIITCNRNVSKKL